MFSRFNYSLILRLLNEKKYKNAWVDYCKYFVSFILKVRSNRILLTAVKFHSDIIALSNFDFTLFDLLGWFTGNLNSLKENIM